ncbi:hypothetical protein [Nitrospirillum sp. BR 11163]|uniref:hypothetical protein n=1 Tax=Nitrospirillum sp. BR 11163 TaxID=3104323 RepID=UPI002AFF5260|nr:hypothetical protein [Nitrospirillum sp. BR 11163]MEA1674063.1 hypothetical protein [Nitrospirillum sp. BR 11163]
MKALPRYTEQDPATMTGDQLLDALAGVLARALARRHAREAEQKAPDQGLTPKD